MELSHKEGLVLPAERAGPTRALTVSSLLLRLDALAAAGLLTREQFASLRNQCWAQDFTLIQAYESVRGGPGPGRACCPALTRVRPPPMPSAARQPPAHAW